MTSLLPEAASAFIGIGPLDPEFYQLLTQMLDRINFLDVQVDALEKFQSNIAQAEGYGYDCTFCNLMEDGGTNGDTTTQASFTYTAMDITDTEEFGTALSPVEEIARANLGLIVSGDGKVGFGYFDTDSTFILYDANEQPVKKACP